MSFWQAVVGIVVGTGLGALAHYFLSARGPLHGVPQMVLGRMAFGFKGNAVPAVLMSVTAGVGWFATNSVSGAYALAALFGIGPLVGLIIIVLLQTAFAFFGHNLVQAFEKWSFPVLAVIFAVASVAILAKSHFGAPAGAEWVGGHGRLPADGRHRVRVRRGLDAVRGGLHAVSARRRCRPHAPDCSRRRDCSCPASCWRSSARRR